MAIIQFSVTLIDLWPSEDGISDEKRFLSIWMGYLYAICCDQPLQRVMNLNLEGWLDSLGASSFSLTSLKVLKWLDISVVSGEVLQMILNPSDTFVDIKEFSERT